MSYDELKNHLFSQAQEFESWSKLIKAKGLTLDSQTFSTFMKELASTIRICYGQIEKIEEAEKEEKKLREEIQNLNKKVHLMTEQIHTLNQVKGYFLKMAELLVNMPSIEYTGERKP